MESAEKTGIDIMCERNVSSEPEPELRFSIRLLIRHPSIAPSAITEALGLTPHLSTTAGEGRKTPRGGIVSGTYKVSTWSYAKDILKTRHFFRELSRFLEVLEPNKLFFHKIENSGGSAILIIDMPGDKNLGDELSFDDLRRIADMKINLGMEVFPSRIDQ